MDSDINYKSTTVTLTAYVSAYEVLHLPMFHGIKAGFPSPAADFIDTDIDLVKELVKNPASTYLGKVVGDSMKDVGIDDGDIIIVDKSLDFQDNNIVVAFINGDFTIKRLKREKNGLWLLPANSAYGAIKVDQGDDFAIWGTVVKIIKDVKNVRTNRL